MIEKTYAVAVALADIRGEPASSAELVTQALMNTPAIAGETSGNWTHVTLIDKSHPYEGWIHSQDLAEPAVKGYTRMEGCCPTPLDLVAFVTTMRAPLYVDAAGDEIAGKVYLSTTLPLLDSTHPQRFQVALPGEDTAWLPCHTAVIRLRTSHYSPQPVSVVTRYARNFLHAPYLWGGTSCEGIDCSALAQLCYRMAGYPLPRDAWQQQDALSYSVSREEMREGDLIFFGRDAITHVAIALNAHEYIHAEGQRYNRVTINSFDPSSPDYDRRLANLFRDIRRVVTENE